jgi:hypothetical protein
MITKMNLVVAMNSMTRTINDVEILSRNVYIIPCFSTLLADTLR